MRKHAFIFQPCFHFHLLSIQKRRLTEGEEKNIYVPILLVGTEFCLSHIIKEIKTDLNETAYKCSQGYAKSIVDKNFFADVL